MSRNFIPVKSINVPNGGLQQVVSVTESTPIFSSYTGNFVGYGPIPFGTISDAPYGDKNYNNPFHVIVHNPVNNTFMVHQI